MDSGLPGPFAKFGQALYRIGAGCSARRGLSQSASPVTRAQFRHMRMRPTRKNLTAGIQ